MILIIEINSHTIEDVFEALESGGYYGVHTFPTHSTLQVVVPNNKNEEKNMLKVCAELIRNGIGFTFSNSE